MEAEYKSKYMKYKMKYIDLKTRQKIGGGLFSSASNAIKKTVLPVAKQMAHQTATAIKQEAIDAAKDVSRQAVSAATDKTLQAINVAQTHANNSI